MTTEAIGTPRPRPDTPAKVRGATRFASDRPMRGLLHARLVLAPRAHARIVSIEREAALAVPGVVAVLTAADLPLKGEGSDRLSRPLARSEVVFAGEPVALVVGRTPQAAADGAELVEVRLEALPTVVDTAAAMIAASPLARVELAAEGDRTGSMDAQTHAGVGGGGDESIDAEVLSDNVTGRYRYRDGDPLTALGRSAITREGTFSTSWIHQGYLEPQVCTAWLDDDDTLVIETSTQSLFGARSEVAKALGHPAAPGSRGWDAARRRVRRQVAAVRHARSSGGVEAPQARPVCSHAIGGFRGGQPGPATRLHDQRQRGRGGPVHAARGADRRGRRRVRGGECGVARRRPGRRAVRVARVRREGLRRPNEPVRCWGVSGANRAADVLRARDARRRGCRGARHRPDRDPPPEPRRRRHADGRWRDLDRAWCVRGARCPRGERRLAGPGRGAGSSPAPGERLRRPTTKASASPWATGPARRMRPPRPVESRRMAACRS